MSLRRHPWRELWYYWVPPLVILVFATSLLVVYRSEYAARGSRLERQIESVRKQAERVGAQRRQLEAMRDARQRSVQAEQVFYSQRLGRRADRLTDVLREVKDLAGRAGIRPSSIQYSTQVDRKHEVERVGLSFSVEGSFAQLRTFIHLLGVSDSFLVLEDVNLTQGNPAATRLRIQLRLATYFAAGPEEAASVAEGAG